MGKITAIVLAAGKGNRMHSEVPKQFLELDGKPVLYYSLNAFEQSNVDSIILVTGKDDIEYCKEQIIEKYHFNKVRTVVEGGTERYWSVKNGLAAAKCAEYVLIHDAARPCIGQDIIERSIIEVMRNGSCTVGMPVKDTIKIADAAGFAETTPDRSLLWIIQTPQVFETELVKRAYGKLMEQKEIHVTDDAMVVEQMLGEKVKLVQGSYENIKITTPEDLDIAAIFVEKLK